jgi:hypothetical protein
MSLMRKVLDALNVYCAYTLEINTLRFLTVTLIMVSPPSRRVLEQGVLIDEEELVADLAVRHGPHSRRSRPP